MCYVGVSMVKQKPNIDGCACLKGVLIKCYLLAQDFYCSKIKKCLIINYIKTLKIMFNDPVVTNLIGARAFNI